MSRPAIRRLPIRPRLDNLVPSRGRRATFLRVWDILVSRRTPTTCHPLRSAGPRVASFPWDVAASMPTFIDESGDTGAIRRRGTPYFPLAAL